MKRTATLERLELRPLSQNEIEQRIETVGAEMGAALAAARTAGRARRPRWIEPAALVRRMAPFIVLN